MVIPSTTERGEGVCVAAITIIGDDSVEGNETFRVTIQPANPNDIVLTSESTANVTVIDDDGTYVLTSYLLCFLFCASIFCSNTWA